MAKSPDGGASDAPRSNDRVADDRASDAPRRDDGAADDSTSHDPANDDPAAAAERARRFDRLINFSDGVVAIAATLLILPLVDTATALGNRTVGELLSDDRSELFAFALSFVVICRFWLIHHHVYRHAIAYSAPLVWVNIAWLLCIVFLPFPTELLGKSNEHGRLVDGLYIGTMLVATFANLAALWIIARSPDLRRPDTRDDTSLTGAGYACAAMALAFVIAIAAPNIGLYALLLLIVPADQITRRVMRRRVAP
jgi:uncharacterized membrane protein